MTIILASTLSDLHTRIALILGNGAGQNGYGQSVVSSEVLPEVNIAADDLNNIYADMLRARIHQVGPGDIGIAEVIEDLNVIATETSFFVNNTGVTQIDAEGVKKGIADFERIMNQIEADKFLVHPSQAAPELTTSSVRTLPWNGLITHEVQVNFLNEDHRRHFFNTGGEIRFTANNTAASTLKGLSWTQLLSQIGTVKFGANATVSTTGSGTNIGNYGLTNAFQVIYQRDGSGLYLANKYEIRARLDNPARIIFNISFNDIAAIGDVDNDVDGRLESVVLQYRAVGDYVEVVSPSYFNSLTLA